MIVGSEVGNPAHALNSSKAALGPPDFIPIGFEERLPTARPIKRHLLQGHLTTHLLI